MRLLSATKDSCISFFVSFQALIKIGKTLAKNNVAADVVSMGEIDDNSEKLEAFIGAVNKSNNR